MDRFVRLKQRSKISIILDLCPSLHDAFSSYILTILDTHLFLYQFTTFTSLICLQNAIDG